MLDGSDLFSSELELHDAQTFSMVFASGNCNPVRQRHFLFPRSTKMTPMFGSMFSCSSQFRFFS